MPKFRNTDYKPHSWLTVEKPLSSEGFLLFIVSELGNSSDFRANILGALSTLAHEETWDYDTEISSAYAQLEVFFMDFCEKVADCITNNEGVQNALALWMSESGNGVSPNGANTNVGNANPFLSNTNLLGASCDSEDLAGQCVAIIEYLNQTAQDWIEGMIAFTLPAEIAGYAAQSVPVMNSSGVDFGDIADWIVDEVLTQYVGAYDEALRNEAACLLLEKCCNDCILTLDDILDAFAPEIGVNIDPVTAWSALLADIVTLSVPDEIVYGVWQLICATWKIGSQFLGVSGINALAYSASKFTPIDPVTIGCDPCGTIGFDLVLSYPICGTSGYGTGANLTNAGVSPLNAAWTRYTFNPSTNSPAWNGDFAGVHPSGVRIRETENRQFKLQAAGRTSGSGSVVGRQCTNGASYELVSWSFGDTNLDLTMYGFYYACGNNSMTLYIDVEWV